MLLSHTSPMGMLFFPWRSRVCELLLLYLPWPAPKNLPSIRFKWKQERGRGQRCWERDSCFTSLGKELGSNGAVELAEFLRDWGKQEALRIIVVIHQDLFFFFPFLFPPPFFLFFFIFFFSFLFSCFFFAFFLFLSVLISSLCFHGRSNILKHYLKTDLTESAKKAREVGFLLSKLCNPVCLLSCTLIERATDRKKEKKKKESSQLLKAIKMRDCCL